MSTQMIKPLHAQRLDIRCAIVDVVLSNVANHLVFSLSGNWIRGRLPMHLRALASIFAGQVTLVGGTLHVQGARRALHICVV